MNQPNFGSILDQAPSSISRPKPLPVGSYTTICKGYPRQDKSSKKGTEFVEFTLGIVSAGEDVDEEDLALALKKPGEDEGSFALSEKSFRHTFYLTDASIYRLVDFLVHLGFEIEPDGNGGYKGVGDDEDKTLRQMISETPNRQVGVNIKHQPSEDGSTVYANVASTFKVE